MEKYTKEEAIGLLGFLFDNQFAYRKEDNAFVFLGEKVNGNPTAEAQRVFEKKIFEIVNSIEEK